jgi:hypothetical protein
LLDLHYEAQIACAELWDTAQANWSPSLAARYAEYANQYGLTLEEAQLRRREAREERLAA